MFQEQMDKLSSEEQSAMTDAIAQITLLIAGADGQIDEDELNWSKKITEIRSYANEDVLNAYYEKVGTHYSARLIEIKNGLPADATAHLTAEISKLNGVLAKFPTELGAAFYKSFTTFAKHVAKSSGGILGFGSISKAEKDLMDLPMLTPIVLEES